jgi:glutathione S-transferase
MYNAKAGDEYKAFLKDRLTKRFLVLDEQLGERPWLWGDRFTVADGYATYVLRAWKRVVKAEIPGKHLPAYYERLIARPSVRDAMAAEGIEP